MKTETHLVPGIKKKRVMRIVVRRVFSDPARKREDKGREAAEDRVSVAFFPKPFVSHNQGHSSLTYRTGNNKTPTLKRHS